MTKLAQPLDAERRKALAAMSDATREIAKQGDEIIKSISTNSVLGWHQLGTLAKEVKKDNNITSVAELEYLSTYWGMEGTAQHRVVRLYELIRFATLFDAKFVKHYMAKPMANGRYLTMSHWAILSQLESRQKIEALLKKTLTRSLDRDGLRALLADSRSGSKSGTSSGLPKTPIQGLNQLLKPASAIFENMKVWERSIFKPLDSIDEEQASDGLLETTEKAFANLEKVEEAVSTCKKRLTSNIHHIREQLEKAEHAEKPSKNGQPAKAASKPAKKGRRPDPVPV